MPRGALLCVIAAVLSCPFTVAAAPYDTTISGNTTYTAWTAYRWSGRVRLDGALTVRGDLLIDPGTEIIATTRGSINVVDIGSIHVAGSVAVPVRFTADQDDDGAYGEPGETWGGISSSSAALVLFQYAIIEYGRRNNGGAVSHTGSGSFRITGCEFLRNTATASGGAVYASSRSGGTLEIAESYFHDNKASDGGAIYAKDLGFRMADSSFVDNTATSPGGQSDGGALSLDQCAFVDINRCSFVGNHADSQGGAAHVVSPNVASLNVLFTNCVFYGNTSSLGGALVLEGQSVSYITNCTFTRNSGGTSAGVYVAGNGAESTLTNCILWDNDAGDDIDLDAQATVIMTDSIVQTGYAGGTRILDTDPLLLPLGYYGGDILVVPVAEGSPAIGAGVPTVPGGADISGDAQGTGRPSLPTIGAMEPVTGYTNPVLQTLPPSELTIDAATVTLSPVQLAATETVNAQIALFLKSCRDDLTVTGAGQVVHAQAGTVLRLDVPGQRIRYDVGRNSYYVDRECGDYPVIGITWAGAIAFCNWLSTLRGLTPCYDLADGSCDASMSGFRLPSEAQWEAGARYVDGTTWGAPADHSGAPLHPDPATCAWYRVTSAVGSGLTAPNIVPADSPRGMHRVGLLEANGLGLRDMSGNVAEWCGDRYSASPFAGGSLVDPTGPATGSSRVVRGGHYNDAVSAIASGARAALTETGAGSRVGFRMSRPVRIFRVDSGASGADDGSSWTDAFRHLTDALAAAGPGDRIWVADGVYRPDDTAHGSARQRDVGDARSYAFVLPDGVEILGGFGGATGNADYPAGETLAAQRRPEKHRAILSGDLAGDDADADGDGFREANRAENAYHVVLNEINGCTSATVLDGFTVSGGTADGAAEPHGRGGGMLNDRTNPRVRNCVFENNLAKDGGAIMARNAGTATNPLVIENSCFARNVAYDNPGTGGAISGYNLQITVANCTFSENCAPLSLGGAIILNGSVSRCAVTNCTFYSNGMALGGDFPNGAGGAAYVEDGSATITNCIFLGNADVGGVSNVEANYGTFTLRHCVLEGHPVTSGCDADGNTGDSPWLAPTGLAYNGGPTPTIAIVSAASSAIDAGDDAAAPSEDQRGFLRYDVAGFGSATADIGAYEFIGPTLEGLDGPTFLENTVNAAPQVLDGEIDFRDPDGLAPPAAIRVSYLAGGAAATESLAVLAAGDLAYDAAGRTVSWQGSPIGTVDATADGTAGAALRIAITADPGEAALKALLQSLAYRNTDDSPELTRTLRFSIVDAHGMTAAADMVVAITPENELPVVSGPVTVRLSEDAPATSADLLAGASDVDGDTLSVTDFTRTGGDDRGIALDADGHTLHIDPSAYAGLAVGESEVISWTYTISDGNGGTVSQTASVTVTGANDAPQGPALGTVNLTDADPVYTQDLLAGVSDAEGDDLTVSLAVTGGPASGVTLDADGHTVRIDPSVYAYLAAGESVTVRVTTTVTDGNSGSLVRGFDVVISGTNTPPRFISLQTVQTPTRGYNGMFGAATAVSGAVAAVSAPAGWGGSGSLPGRVYIFRQYGREWVETDSVQPSDSAIGDGFGFAVAIDGDVLVASTDTQTVGGFTKVGKVYVFRRIGTDWVEEAILDPGAEARANLRFGHCLSMSGGRIAVGTVEGGVHIFRDDGGTWTREAVIPGASETLATDRFGWGVSLDGDRLLVGAPARNDGLREGGAAYVFRREGTSWLEEAKFAGPATGFAPRFGCDVALRGEVALVGASGNNGVGLETGAAYIHVRNADGTWRRGATFGSPDPVAFRYFGSCVAAAENGVLMVGSYGPSSTGVVHVIRREGGADAWRIVEEIDPRIPMTYFAYSPNALAASGTVIVAGGPYDWYRGVAWFTDLLPYTGPVQAGVRAGDTEEFTLVAADDEGEALAWSVVPPAPAGTASFGFSPTASTYGNIVAATTDPAFTGTGSFAVRVADASGATADLPVSIDIEGTHGNTVPYFTEQAVAEILSPFGGAQNTGFGGEALSADGDLLVVGAPYATRGNPGEQGVAVIYRRDPATGTWTVEQILENPAPMAGGHYGARVAVDGETVAVGWPEFSFGASSEAGMADVFRYAPDPVLRPGQPWVRDRSLLASAPAAGERFGDALALRDGVLAVGAPGHTVGAVSGAGAAYVYREGALGWTVDGPLTAPVAPFVAEHFGASVALDGDTLVVGVPNHARRPNAGAGHFFRYDGSTWLHEQQVIPVVYTGVFAGAAADADGGMVMLGAPGSATFAGYVFNYQFNGSVWEISTSRGGIPPMDTNARFGSALSLAGERCVVGAPGDGRHGASSGSVFCFEYADAMWGRDALVLHPAGAADQRFGSAVALGPHGAFAGYSAAGANPVGGVRFLSWSERGPLDRTTEYETAFTLPLFASDNEDDSLTWGWTPSRVGASKSLAGSGGIVSLTYTPPPGFSGFDTFAVTVSDGKSGTALLPIRVYVEPRPNTDPVATADTIVAIEDVPLALPVSALLANDTDAEGDTLTLTGVTAVSGVAVSLADGMIRLVPAAELSGTGTFTYDIEDGWGGTAMGTVTVRILPVNDLPTVSDAKLAIFGGSTVPLAGGLFAGLFSDPEGSALAAVRIDRSVPAAGCTLELSGVPVAAGDTIPFTLLAGLTFSSPAGFTGTASITWSGSDGTDFSPRPANLVLDAAPNSGPPVGSEIRDRVAYEGTPFSLDVGPFFRDPDGDPIAAFDFTGLPGWLTETADGILTGTPPAGTAPETSTIGVTATAADGSVTTSFRLTVLPPADEDSDGDGYTNREETESGTDPADGSSLPVIFVDCDATSGARDGSSWYDAFLELGSALAVVAARPGTWEVWIAEGTYRPNDEPDGSPGGSFDPANHFRLPRGARLYGGFAGDTANPPPANTGETLREERLPGIHRVVLSGDQANDGPAGSDADNCRSVVICPADTGDTIVLDGVTVTAGRGAIGAGLRIHGSSPLVHEVIFEDNGGDAGGAAGVTGPSDARFERCVFRTNRAFWGGALFASGGDPVLRTCLLYDNVAGICGGALGLADGASATVAVSTVADNVASHGGAGIYAHGAGVRLTNSALWRNTTDPAATVADDFLVYAGTLDADHCAAVEAPGGPGAVGLTLSNDPLAGGAGFLNPGTGDYRPGTASPLVDAGDNDMLPGDVALDLAWLPRLADGDGDGIATVDCGAYEFGSGYTIAGTIQLEGYLDNPSDSSRPVTFVPVDRLGRPVGQALVRYPVFNATVRDGRGDYLLRHADLFGGAGFALTLNHLRLVAGLRVSAPGFLARDGALDFGPEGVAILDFLEDGDGDENPTDPDDAWLLGGDFDGDNIVNHDDYRALLTFWGAPVTAVGTTDSTGDGVMSVSDYLIMIKNWLGRGAGGIRR